MKLTKEQIDEIVAAAYPTPHADTDALRDRLARAFGERVNPYDVWRYSSFPACARAHALFDAAANVADGCDGGGGLLATTHYPEVARAALKRIVDEIRGMA